MQAGAITNVGTIDIKGAATLGPITDASSIIASSLALKEVQVGKDLTDVPANNLSLVLNTPSQSVKITASSLETLKLAKGGKLIIDKSMTVTKLDQDGEIKLDSGATVTPPFVTADNIVIGNNATLVFDSASSKEGQVLMTATAKDINQPVAVVGTKPGQYDHYHAILNPKDKKKMILAIQPMKDHICKLAFTGGAPASAVRAVDIAVAPKKVPAADAQSRATVDDPLNAFVVQRATSPATAANLAKQLTPNDTGSNITAARDAQQMSSKAIDTRNTNRRTGMNSGDMMESGGVWIQYAYNDAKQDEKDGVFGYKDKTNGFTPGADWELDPMFDAGLAYTYAKSDISGEGAGSGSTMDSKNHIFTLYGSYDQDDMFMDGMISYASGDNKGHRNVSGNRVQSSYDSKSWGIGLSGGMTLPSNEEWSWQPLVAFNYYRITTDDYRESAPLNYLAFDQVKNDDYTIIELGVGVRLMGDIQSDDLAFRPAFKLMVLHDFKDDPVTMTAHYAAGGNSFVVHGAKRDTTRYQFAASVDMDLHDNMTLSFNYSHDWMDNFKSDGFIARLRYDF